MIRLACLLAVLGLAGCAGGTRFASCPAGQEPLRTAQLFLGGAAQGRLSDAALHRFVREEISPRFPQGVTVIDGGRQWAGPQNRLLRQAAKVVTIVLPSRGDAGARVEAVRAAYKARFRQETPPPLTQSACLAI